MKLTVLLPTMYRPDGLQKALQSMIDTAPNVYAVVAHEKDDTDAALIAMLTGAKVTVCQKPKQGNAYAWNTAFRAAIPSDLYLLGSDDMIFTPGWYEAGMR
jgi:glycosyltransferase involved in cell wall biosynthesis